MAIKIIEGLIALRQPAKIIGKNIWLISKPIAKLVFILLILPAYQLLTRTKKKINIVKKTEIKYILFIKKYAARILVFIIVVIVTSNNIFAQSYSSDEITNKSLLIKIVSPPEERLNELIEEEINTNAPLAINYSNEQGALQENVISTPFPEDNFLSEENNVSPDSSSLVINNPMEEGHGDATITDRTETISYTVQEGDVLGSIAEKFEISVNTILWENGLTWNSTIRPGQKLTIPPGTGISYTVKSGDTILAIAKKYQADSDQIVSVNKLASATDIRAGQKVFIPNGIKPTEITSSYKPKATTPIYEEKPKTGNTAVDAGTKLLWPLDSHRITQYFSLRHTGLDVGDKTGNPIYAAEAGKVEKAGWNSGGYGNYIIINHGNGLQTLYGHASKLYVKTGDTVSRGELIAAVGNTGRSTGPHLHFEVRINEIRTNPLNYIK